MAEATDPNDEGSDGSNSGPSGSSGSIIDWLTQPLGMAFVGGLVAAIIAGYYVI